MVAGVLPIALMKRFWMPIANFVMGMLSIAVLVWSLHLHSTQQINFSLADAIMDMQIDTATSHLWFVKLIHGDRNIVPDDVWARIDDGIRLSSVILNGGVSEDGLVVAAMTDPWLRTEAETIGALLIQLKSIALQRYQTPGADGIGSLLDQQFDGLFEEFMTRARGFEQVVETRRISDLIKERRLCLGIVFAWAIVVIGATAGLTSREWHRLVAEQELQGANQQLEAQTEELNRHRSHLLELVDERTADVTSANQSLRKEIDEHKRTLRELEVSRSGFQKLTLEFNALLDAIPDPILLLSPQLTVQYANSSAAATARLGQAELASRHCYELRDRRSSPCDECPALQTFQTGRIGWRQFSAPNGTVWEIKTFPIRNGNGEIKNVIEVSTDITEKLALQAESMRMARLASMGELAAGVAHEINNPVNGIVNCAQILIDESQGGGDETEILTRIINAGTRIATIVQSLLSFARQDKAEKLPIQIDKILADTLALSRTQLEKDGIVLKLDVPSGLPRISANAQQIEQVFLNIINNARHALNAKFPQTHENKVLEIQGQALSIENLPYVRVTFHDRGTGISQELMNRIMEPFFTTKDSSSGTGLGLSISHGIVTDHGGTLTIKSIEDQFTRVEVILPVCSPADKLVMV
jgi:two-component system NtrC family sensor kinase